MAARATVTPCSSVLGSGGDSSSSLYLHSHNDHVHILYVGGWSGGPSSVGAVASLAPAHAYYPTAFSWSVAIPAPARSHFSIVAAHVRLLPLL